MAIKKAEAGTLEVAAIKHGSVVLRIIGETPMYQNSMSAKAMRTLLVGGGKKTAAEKKQLKHDPHAEFIDSMHRLDDGPTLIGFPAAGVKSAMATAALETAGIAKSSVQRLVFLPDAHIAIFGIPQLKCDIVRSADINRTPDVRTRAYLPRWCAEVRIRFATPTLSTSGIVSLLSNAGAIVGIGDFRQEKGRGSFGTFSVHGQDMEPEYAALWDDLTNNEGRAAQLAAMHDPEPADGTTAELLEFLEQEKQRRAA